MKRLLTATIVGAAAAGLLAGAAMASSQGQGLEQKRDVQATPPATGPIKKVHYLFVTAPKTGYICAVGMDCPIRWRLNADRNYPTVWLQVVDANGTPSAGAYPVPNTGLYHWKPDIHFWDRSIRCKDWRILVSTPDRRFKGMSGTFKVGKFLNHCP
jgi:hypothetical protein